MAVSYSFCPQLIQAFLIELSKFGDGKSLGGLCFQATLGVAAMIDPS